MSKIVKKITVPTGDICVMKGEKGNLEFLSIGDYGKNLNIKADFLGIKKELNGVPNGVIMPLKEKWVITISTQYGCSMGCKFCDVPKVGRGLNCTLDDLNNQLTEGLSLHPEVYSTKRLNLHYARMGEPTWNKEVLTHAKSLHKIIKPYIGNSMIHPVISTMMPKGNKMLNEFLSEWSDIKNYNYRGDAGLQLSINSTDEKQRQEMFSGNALSLGDVSKIADCLPDPIGRKYALNFALADNYIIDAIKLLDMFDPKKFMVKITPMHITKTCTENNLLTSNGYDSFVPYKTIEKELIDVGFDVLVFVPSYDEDKGLITCGNAILSGSVPQVDYKVMQYNIKVYL